MIEEMTKSEELLERRKKAVANGVGVFNRATVQSAKGAIITDTEGRELIDFAGGIGVVNAGHCPDPVVKALQEQAGKYLHTSFNVVTYEPYIELCEKLCELLPHGESTKAMLISTGAEAVENAIKIARQATKRPAVICFSDAYHGRTMMAMSLTSKITYKPDCGPFAPEVYRIPFPNYYRFSDGRSKEQFVADKIYELHEYFKNGIRPEEVAAIILEPVQGEGGFNPTPKAYLQELRKVCDEHGIMLIFDEVQSGFARCGNWASWQEYGVTPDLSTYAKSMGSGLPIAAVVGKAEVMDSAALGSIGGTYIGSPMACVAALETIRYMEEIDLNSRGKEVGDILRHRMEELKAKCPAIGDVRGLGAMMAIEFVHDGNPKKQRDDVAAKIVAGCLEKGLIVISAGTFKNIIRVLSPLVISNEDLNRGMDVLEEVTLEVCAN
jgi:4-aminobutyrate aminotransferase/(S)-3-amino-2-methylpropionate transaminase